MFKKILALFENAIFPSKCFVCKSFLEINTSNPSVKDILRAKDFSFKTLFSPYLCDICLDDFNKIDFSLCDFCKKNENLSDLQFNDCNECILKQKYISHVHCISTYDLSLMELIHKLKYNEKTCLSKPLGLLLFSGFLQKYCSNLSVDIITPIPLHIKRFKKRGFNQAFLLIKDWKKYLKISRSSKNNILIYKDLLVRTKMTTTQTNLNKNQRQQNIKNAFALNPKYNSQLILNKNILLIDDVYTTGATANECAKVLIKNGAHKVNVLTLAYTVR